MRPYRSVLFLTLAIGFAACGGDDSPKSPVIPTSYGAPKVLQVTGGDAGFNVVGQQRQFTALATFENGLVRNVTTLVEWRTSNAAVATVTAGLVKIVAVGNAEITATFRGVTSSAALVSANSPALAVSITIAGPAEVAPGSTAQFTATAHFSDGSSRDVTTAASWFSQTSQLLRHAGSGRFEGLAVGDARINVNFGGRSGTVNVIVVPSGTFKLAGTIRDASGAVDNVLVEVVSGTGQGASAKSLFNGAYAVFGVAGVVQLRASAPGYTTQEFAVTMTGHGSRDVTMVTPTAPVDVSGNWKLVISTSSACSDSWSAAARRREVAAVVTQSGTRLTIKFPAAAIFVFDNAGRMAGNAFSMTLFTDFYYLDYGLTERISPTEWVGVNGAFTGTATPSLITGAFAGNFNYYQTVANASFPVGAPQTCTADPTFEFRR